MSTQDGHEDLDDVEGKIFIGGLSWQTSEGTLRSHFEKFGELTDVALMVDKRTGQPRGFGFIKLKYPAAADIVVAQEHIIDGRKVDVKKAVPRDRAPAPTRTESRKIFVGGLSADVTDKVFSDYFAKFGPVKDAVVMVDRSTNRSRGFGFVTFENEDSVENVLKNENTILGKWVEVKRAEPRDMKFDTVGSRGSPTYRGGRIGTTSDPRLMSGRYGGGRGTGDDYQTGYGAMGGYPRGYGASYPAGYGPTAAYGIQPGYPGGGYGGYPQGPYAGYGPAAGQQIAGYSNPQAYTNRAPGHEDASSQGATTNVTGGYGLGSGASTQPTQGGGGVGGSYDSYGRTQQQQQYSYPSSAAIGGYGGAYGLYGATTAAAPRTMTAQDAYEGAYGAYRQGNAAQNRLDRGYKPY